jgi:hypothetical protein
VNDVHITNPTYAEGSPFREAVAPVPLGNGGAAAQKGRLRWEGTALAFFLQERTPEPTRVGRKGQSKSQASTFVTISRAPIRIISPTNPPKSMSEAATWTRDGWPARGMAVKKLKI